MRETCGFSLVYGTDDGVLRINCMRELKFRAARGIFAHLYSSRASNTPARVIATNKSPGSIIYQSRGTMKTSMENYLWGLLLPLAVPIAECFLILGEVRSGVPQSRNGDCCANRRLHHMHAHTTALEVPARKITRLSPVRDHKEKTMAYGSALNTSFRLHKVKHHSFVVQYCTTGLTNRSTLMIQ